jgi:hypothetical protein
MHRSISWVALALAWLSAACFGNKVFSEGGGGGGGSATTATGTATGGSADGGAGGEGGGLQITCAPEDEGELCEGGAACGSFRCVASECTLQQTLPVGTVVGDNDVAGDCIGLVCPGNDLEPVEGPSNDPPVPRMECFVGTCTLDGPAEIPGPVGGACSNGVCSGTDLGCVECLGWANCALGEVCVASSTTCADCSAGNTCANGNPGGLRCTSGACGCLVQTDCLGSAAGTRCKANSATCGCGAQSDCTNAAFGTACIDNTDCGCQGAADCVNSGLGKACVMDRCGCSVDADCSGSALCDVTANVCVADPGND